MRHTIVTTIVLGILACFLAGCQENWFADRSDDSADIAAKNETAKDAEIRRLEEDIHALDDEVAKLSSRNEELIEEARQLQYDLDDRTFALKHKDKQLEAFAETVRQRDRYQKQMDELTKENRQLNKYVERLENEVQALTKELEKVLETYEDLIEESATPPEKSPSSDGDETPDSASDAHDEAPADKDD